MSLKNTDVRTPGAQAIAKKWNLPLTKVYALISQGAKVEFEHNRDKEKAKQVARDHINERPDYYKRLKHMERLPIRMRESSVNEGLSTEPERDSETIGDYTGASRKVMKVDEITISPKVKQRVKKAVAAGVTAANLATYGQVAGDAAEGRGSPVKSAIAVATGLPGKVGYGMSAAHYSIKGAEKAKEYLKGKKMEEQGSPANPARYTERPMYEQMNTAQSQGSMANIRPIQGGSISTSAEKNRSISDTIKRLPPIKGLVDAGVYRAGKLSTASPANTEKYSNLSGVTPKVDTHTISKMVQGGRTPPMGTPKLTTSTNPTDGSEYTSYTATKPAWSGLPWSDESSKYAMDAKRHLELNKERAAGAKPIATELPPIKGITNASDYMEKRRQMGYSGKSDPDFEAALNNVRYGAREPQNPAGGGSQGTTPMTSGGGNSGSSVSPTTPSDHPNQSPETQRNNDIIHSGPGAARKFGSNGITNEEKRSFAAYTKRRMYEQTNSSQNSSMRVPQNPDGGGLQGTTPMSPGGGSSGRGTPGPLTPSDAPGPTTPDDANKNKMNISEVENDAMKNAEDKIKAAFTKDKVKDMFKRVDKERDKDPKWVAYKKRKESQLKEMDTSRMRPSSNIDDRRGIIPSIKGAYQVYKDDAEDRGITGTQAQGAAAIDTAKDIASRAANKISSAVQDRFGPKFPQSWSGSKSSTGLSAAEKQPISSPGGATVPSIEKGTTSPKGSFKDQTDSMETQTPGDGFGSARTFPVDKQGHISTDQLVKDYNSKTPSNRQMNEISAELVGKVSNARFWRGEAPSKTLTRAINKKFIESGKPVPKKKDTKTVKEETTMDTKELINEALDDILENNLVSMKENFLTALQEKAMERLEEKKKEIAANYFAQ